MKIDLDKKDIGALLFLIGAEIGRLRSIEDSQSYEEVLNNEINFYKTLAFKINGTDE